MYSAFTHQTIIHKPTQLQLLNIDEHHQLLLIFKNAFAVQVNFIFTAAQYALDCIQINSLFD